MAAAAKNKRVHLLIGYDADAIASDDTWKVHLTRPLHDGLDQVRSHLLDLEDAIPWNAVDHVLWESAREPWFNNVCESSTPEALATSMLNLEAVVLPCAFSTEWAALRPRWREATTAAGMSLARLRDLLLIFESRLRWLAFCSHEAYTELLRTLMDSAELRRHKPPRKNTKSPTAILAGFQRALAAVLRRVEAYEFACADEIVGAIEAALADHTGRDAILELAWQLLDKSGARSLDHADSADAASKLDLQLPLHLRKLAWLQGGRRAGDVAHGVGDPVSLRPPRTAAADARVRQAAAEQARRRRLASAWGLTTAQMALGGTRGPSAVRELLVFAHDAQDESVAGVLALTPQHTLADVRLMLAEQLLLPETQSLFRARRVAPPGAAEERRAAGAAPEDGPGAAEDAGARERDETPGTSAAASVAGGSVSGAEPAPAATAAAGGTGSAAAGHVAASAARAHGAPPRPPPAGDADGCGLGYCLAVDHPTHPALVPIEAQQDHKLAYPFFPDRRDVLVARPRPPPDLTCATIAEVVLRHRPTERLLCADLSAGVERSPIAVYNGADDEPAPLDFTYVPVCVGAEGVRVLSTYDLHSGHPSGCGCKSGCALDGGCVCVHRDGVSDRLARPMSAYAQGRRLKRPYESIYECNELCACSQACPNRIVQRGMQVRARRARRRARARAGRALPPPGPPTRAPARWRGRRRLRAAGSARGVPHAQGGLVGAHGRPDPQGLVRLRVRGRARAGRRGGGARHPVRPRRHVSADGRAGGRRGRAADVRGRDALLERGAVHQPLVRAQLLQAARVRRCAPARCNRAGASHRGARHACF